MIRFLIEFICTIIGISLIGFIMMLVRISFFTDGTYGGY